MNGGGNNILQCDAEINRRLCRVLLERLEEAIRLSMPPSGAVEDGEGASFPSWVAALFGTKEGLSSAYIKLSQQHLKLLAAQMELHKESQSRNPQTEAREERLSREELKTLRMFLDELEDEEEKEQDD